MQEHRCPIVASAGHGKLRAIAHAECVTARVAGGVLPNRPRRDLHLRASQTGRGITVRWGDPGAIMAGGTRSCSLPGLTDQVAPPEEEPHYECWVGADARWPRRQPPSGESEQPSTVPTCTMSRVRALDGAAATPEVWGPG